MAHPHSSLLQNAATRPCIILFIFMYIYQLCITLFYQDHWLQHLSYVWENLGGKNLVTGVQEGPWGKYTWGGEALVKMRNSRKKGFRQISSLSIWHYKTIFSTLAHDLLFRIQHFRNTLKFVASVMVVGMWRDDKTSSGAHWDLPHQIKSQSTRSTERRANRKSTLSGESPLGILVGW